MPWPAPYAPPLLNVSLAPITVTVGLWAAGVLAAGGVLAGLAALARGARFPLWLMIGGAVMAVAALTVLPPTGSTDTLDYAAYGRMVVLGHSPYVMTPDQLRAMGDPIGRAAPFLWGKRVSLYGPLATVEEAAAALLGGRSVARIVFWLKLWNALAFGAVALALDRMVRGDPARRTRVHLLWTVNPLLLWNLIAGGHLDGLAAAAGFLGLALFSASRTDGDPGPLRAAAAGLLIGMAADLKISFALFGLGLIWASRRSLRTALTGAASALVVIVPGYVWFGPPAIAALLSRSGNDSAVSFYRLLSWLPDSNQLILFFALPALALVTAAMLQRFPDHVPDLPAIQPPGPQPRLAVRLALPVSLVRRDGPLHPCPLPGVAAGLAGDRTALRRDHCAHAGQLDVAAADVADQRRNCDARLRRSRADARGDSRAGLAMPHRVLADSAPWPRPPAGAAEPDLSRRSPRSRRLPDPGPEHRPDRQTLGWTGPPG